MHESFISTVSVSIAVGFVCMVRTQTDYKNSPHATSSIQREDTLRMIRGEEPVVEYKRSIDAVEQEDFVALANAKGGTILVGVEERRNHGRQYGEIAGCDVGEEVRRRLLNKAAACLPPIVLRISSEKSGKLSILRVDAQNRKSAEERM